MGLSMGGWATYSSALGIQTQQVYLEKPFTKLGLMEWLKVKALSLSPSTAKRKKKKNILSFWEPITGLCSVETGGLLPPTKTIFQPL
jgi:hypothetical protein